MITGRITYGLGQTALDSYGMPVQSGFFSTPISQSSVVQTPIAQWGPGEIAVALGVAFVVFSVFSTTRRGVRSAQEYRTRRRQRRAREYEAAAEHYKA